MSQAQYASQFQSPAPAGPYSTAAADREIREAENRVREQEAHVLRLIVQGAPTQRAEDLLRELAATAKAMREQLRRSRR
jgi:hypothetical protein